jgi:hypothetical protein
MRDDGAVWLFAPDGRSRLVLAEGDELRVARRLMGVFDMGPRRGEMEAIQIRHVDWAHPKKLVDDATGQAFNGYEITLPPQNTKGGKMTGETQYLYAATLRLSRMLEKRRFQLQNKPTAYIFGTEAGHYVASFKKSWQALFTLAGLEWGREKGLTWHTTRHEFISRVVDATKNPRDGQEAARHKRLETTQRYMHSRRDRRWEVAHGLNR